MTTGAHTGEPVDENGGPALARRAHASLAGRGATLAVAESLTGGLIGATLTEIPGASATFAGGVIVYATGLKTRLLGVPAELLDAHGAVHPDVARAMADGVRVGLAASYGLAVTGVAGPEPQDGQPVGTVHVAVSAAAGPTIVRSLDLGPAGPGVRARVRRLTVVHALDLLCRRLADSDEAGRPDLP